MLEDGDQETFERVWKMIIEIGIAERHFNVLQSKYRTVASTWLLATFSGIGFVISEVININIDPLLLISGIAAAGLIGIMLLWMLDLLVYHRLLDSCFIEGLILEEKYAWLPRVRHNMMATMAGEGVLFRIIGFYIGMVMVLILVSGGSLSLWLNRDSLALPFAGIFLTILAAVLVARYMQQKTENTAAIRERLEESRILDKDL